MPPGAAAAEKSVPRLEERGVQMDKGSTFEEELKALQQMRDIELEAKQSVWQWLIATALILLIAETVLASVWSMPSSSTEATAAPDVG